MDATPLRSHDDFEYIHYAGKWTAEEREVVFYAVAEVENRLEDTFERNTVLGKPWICTQQTLSNSPLYMAHRAKRLKKVLTARSAEELAERIRERATR